MNPSDQDRMVGVVDSWLAQNGVQNAVSNPTAGTVVVETGALLAGWYDFYFHMVPDANISSSFFAWEHRNAANTAILYARTPLLLAFTPFLWNLRGWKMAANERWRLYTNTNWTGVIRADFFWVKRIQ